MARDQDRDAPEADDDGVDREATIAAWAPLWDAITRLRKARNLSQNEFARRLGWRQGKPDDLNKRKAWRGPTWGEVVACAGVLGTTPQEIIRLAHGEADPGADARAKILDAAGRLNEAAAVALKVARELEGAASARPDAGPIRSAPADLDAAPEQPKRRGGGA